MVQVFITLVHPKGFIFWLGVYYDMTGCLTEGDDRSLVMDPVQVVCSLLILTHSYPDQANENKNKQ